MERGGRENVCFGDKLLFPGLLMSKFFWAVQQMNALERHVLKIKSIKPKIVLQCSKKQNIYVFHSLRCFDHLLKLIWSIPSPPKYYFNPLILKEIVLVARRTIKTPIFGTADTMCSQYILTHYSTTYNYVHCTLEDLLPSLFSQVIN